MKRVFTGLIQLFQLICILYVFTTAFVEYDNGLLILAFVVTVNLWMVCRMQSNIKRVADANMQVYRDFARRLGWEDIVSDLDAFKRGRK